MNDTLILLLAEIEENLTAAISISRATAVGGHPAEIERLSAARRLVTVVRETLEKDS